MIHFDFDDRYQDELVVGSAISRREGVVWSVVVHLVILGLLLYVPSLPWLQPTPEELEQARLAELERQQLMEQERPTFVLVEPRLDLPAEQLREQFELSDQDRRSQTPERAPRPENPLPFSRGNTAERTEAAPEPSPRPPEPPATAPAPEPPAPEPVQPETQIARAAPEAPRVVAPEEPRPRPGSIIREAARNAGRYAQSDTFNNPRGGDTEFGPAIQFDTKGIDFGPWLRRFVSQVRRNWFIPQAAMTFRGHVVLQFFIHRDGRITDVQIVKPAHMDSFNRSSLNAILGSNPTEPLPPEYPDDKVLFTVTFYYNEQPGS